MVMQVSKTCWGVLFQAINSHSAKTNQLSQSNIHVHSQAHDTKFMVWYMLHMVKKTWCVNLYVCVYVRWYMCAPRDSYHLSILLI